MNKIRKFELSISKDYVSHWTYVEAVRELFQNALDQEIEDENNPMFFDYDESTETLTIGNKSSVLETNTLLLGMTTKKDNENQIGQFGEGYKLATLALLREEKEVVIYNYGKKEVWRPRFVNSRRYGVPILTMFIDKMYIWEKAPDNNLTIQVSNITAEEYKVIVSTVLQLQSIPKHQLIETPVADILLEKEHKGKIYVNGLYVCEVDLFYGYNFPPEGIELDRDRRAVSTFEANWATSCAWIATDEYELIENLLKNGAPDVNYLSSTQSAENYELSEHLYKSFITEHGAGSVPVSTNSEYHAYRSLGYNPVIMTENYVKMTLEADSLRAVQQEKQSAESLLKAFKSWCERNEHQLHEVLEQDEIQELLKLVNMIPYDIKVKRESESEQFEN